MLSFKRIPTDLRRGCPAAVAIIAALAGIGTAQAQEQRCGSSVEPEQVPELLALERAVYAQAAGGIAGTYEVAITFHIVRQSDGTGGLDPTDLDGLLADLNTGFSGTGVSFCQPGGTDYINSDAFFFDIDTDAELNVLRQTNVVADTINVYFTPNLHLCGKSSFTSNSVQGIVMKNTCQGTTDISGVLTHEVGHYFNLYHTHETTFGVECPDGSNCSTAGDLVCDTPADYNLDFDTCVDAACNIICSVSVPCGTEGYDPSPVNFMSYSRVTCISEFTPNQDSRAVSTLLVLRSNLLNGCPAGNVCGGTGSCFESHATPGCSDHDCCQIVCAVDPFCCDNQWDQTCAVEGDQLCGCGSDLVGSCAFPQSRPACNDEVCCDAVCATDPFCCETQWDQVCANEAAAICYACGGISTGFCTTASSSPNCSDPICCEAVCAVDPSCCSSAWDSGCVSLAQSICYSCGGVSTGDCFVANGGVSCDNVDCCQAVCAADPSCCSTVWDAGCAALAQSLCASCGGSAAGDCFSTNVTPGCDDADCCSAVCVIQPACCAVAWDNQCVVLANLTCNASPGEECLSATPIGDGSHAVSTANNGGLVPADGSCSTDETVDEWYAYTPGCSGVATARICAFFGFPSGDLPEFNLSVFADCAGSEIACSATGPSCALTAASAEVSWSVVAGQTYLICLASPPTDTGSGTLEVSCGGCGLAGSGACDEVNGSIGCEDAACCESVCVVDPFCCTTTWDALCVTKAEMICTSACQQDLDGDGQVATPDLLALLAAWGSCAGCPEDFNGSGSVDTTDLLALLAAWGPCP